MSYFWTCPYCGANLDPGEHCDCLEQEDISRRYHRHNNKFIKSMEDITNELIRD